jgi:ribosomal protein L11 methyltransferase
MLDLFPAGVEEERVGDEVVLAGYAERAPAAGLEADDVAPGWEDGWRAYHRAVTVGGIRVAPPWSEGGGEGPLEIVIDPGRAFGTGGHGSTRAALALLQELEPRPVLDLGCGSGVLAIAAARLGFEVVGAFDVDPLAVEAAAENAARNGVVVPVARADVLADALPAAPLWLANLELRLLGPLLARPDRPALVLASGLLDSETAGGGRRIVVDGWAAELVAR